ncbi:hypothetical protein [Desulfobacter latus]|uniref:Transcription factor WhiB n=1 Tax=Desulfobacter latus TaxID=2292 RepID=A0A850SX67_9BACT|nr:hypothetical protein [Desulfobacter latus]NWH04013.1 hypothetical protein [Desulfobacter latus]
MTDKDDFPDCFGDLEKVFPMGPNGLRETPEHCFYHCPVKTKCLQQALATKDGIQIEEEVLERSTKAGGISFFERWSRKKQAHRRGLKMKK